MGRRVEDYKGKGKGGRGGGKGRGRNIQNSHLLRQRRDIRERAQHIRKHLRQRMRVVPPIRIHQARKTRVIGPDDISDRDPLERLTAFVCDEIEE